MIEIYDENVSGQTPYSKLQVPLSAKGVVDPNATKVDPNLKIEEMSLAGSKISIIKKEHAERRSSKDPLWGEDKKPDKEAKKKKKADLERLKKKMSAAKESINKASATKDKESRVKNANKRSLFSKVSINATDYTPGKNSDTIQDKFSLNKSEV